MLIRKRFFWSLLLAAPFIAVALDSPAHDATCGMRVTGPTVLTQDLSCIGTALVLSAPTGPDPTVIDLGGHTVSSDCLGLHPCATVMVTGGAAAYAQATVRNGRLAAADGSAAMIYDRSPGLILEDVIVDSGPAGGIGPLIVRDSAFVNGAHAYCSDTSITVSNSEFIGGQGISAYFCGATVDNNRFSLGSGVSLRRSWFVVSVTNNVVNGGQILLASTAQEGLRDISGNFVSFSPGHGIEVFDVPNPVTIDNNAAVHSAGDGIHVEGSGDVTVTANLAVANAGLGIDAAGVVDGGGNSASLNGNPLQCVGLHCAFAPACSNAIDDDGDGLVDLEDPGCFDSQGVENPQCQDGIDNDRKAGIDFDGGDSLDIDPRDGFIDAAFNPAMPPVGNPDPQCIGKPYRNLEMLSCGLGAELALVLPALMLARSRRQRVH